MPPSHRQQYANKNVPAEGSSYQKQAGRQHPYARPSVLAPGSRHQTSVYENHGMRQAGPIRHGRSVANSQGLINRQLGLIHQEPSAQEHVSADYKGYGQSYPPSYDTHNSELPGLGSPQGGHFGNEYFLTPQIYPSFPQSSVPDDQYSYRGEQYVASRSNKHLQDAAYGHRAATMHGPSPNMGTSSNAYAGSRTRTTVAASERGSLPANETIDLEQPSEIRPVEKEAEKPNEVKQKNSAKVKRSKEGQRPAKTKVKGQTRFENGRLECLHDPDAQVPQWGKSSFHDVCQYLTKCSARYPNG